MAVNGPVFRGIRSFLVHLAAILTATGLAYGVSWLLPLVPRQNPFVTTLALLTFVGVWVNVVLLGWIVWRLRRAL